MSKKVFYYIVCLIVLFLGISLGTSKSKDDLVVNEEKEVYDITDLEGNYVTSLSKSMEKIVISVFNLIFEIIGGVIRLVTGLS